MTNHFQNEKNILNDDPSAIKTHIELDSNHNQVNSNSVIDLMASRDIDEVSELVSVVTHRGRTRCDCDVISLLNDEFLHLSYRN